MGIDQMLEKEMEKFAEPGEKWMSSSEDNEGFSVTLSDGKGKYIRSCINWVKSIDDISKHMGFMRECLFSRERDRKEVKDIIDMWGKDENNKGLDV